jgi:hypothetical protein
MRRETMTEREKCALDALNAMASGSSMLARISRSQEEEKRKDAYFRWLSRGCPQGDDQSDWFASSGG